MIRKLFKNSMNFSLITTIKYFENYLYVVDMLKNKDTKTTTIFKLLHCCVYLRIVQVLWLYKKQNSLDDYGNWKYFNLVAFENLPDYFNIISVLYLFYALNVLHLLYYHSNSICNVHLKKLLLERNDSFFDNTKIELKMLAKLIKVVFKYDLNGKSTVENIQMLTLLNANFVNCAYILLSKCELKTNVFYFFVFMLDIIIL